MSVSSAAARTLRRPASFEQLKPASKEPIGICGAIFNRTDVGATADGARQCSKIIGWRQPAAGGVNQRAGRQWLRIEVAQVCADDAWRVAAKTVARTGAVANIADEISIPDNLLAAAGVIQATELAWVQPVTFADDQVIGQAQSRGRAAAAATDHAIALANDGVIDQVRLRLVAQSDKDRIAESAAMITGPHVRLARKIGAIANDDGVFDQGRARNLDLVACVGLNQGAPDGDHALIVEIQQVDAVGGIAMDVAVLKDPVATRATEAQAVTVSTTALGPAAEDFTAGPTFCAAVMSDLGFYEADGAAIGAVGADIAIPARPTVGIDPGTLQRPVADPAGMNAAIGQAMDIDIAKADLAGVTRRNAGMGPLAMRRTSLASGHLSGALPVVTMRNDTAAAIGDFEASQFNIGAALQVEHHRCIFGSPQFGWLQTALSMAGSQNAGRLRRRWSTRNGRHMASSGCALGTASRIRRAIAHHETAGPDMESISTGNTRLSARRQCDKGMVPGTGLARSATGIGAVGQTGALAGGAAIAAYIPVRGGGGCRNAQKNEHE